MRIIVDPDQTLRAREALMIEKRIMIEPELERRPGKQAAKLLKVRAGPGGLSEAVADPPQRRSRFSRNASQSQAKPWLP